MRAACLGALVFSLSSACGGDHHHAADAGTDALFTSCVGDPRAEIYRPGLSKRGDLGALTVTLQASQPAPPHKGTNQWTVLVTDAAGAPVPGVTIAVSSFMPDHNHGSSVKAVVRPGETPGQYFIDSIYFFMLGLWRVTLTLSGPAADTVVFPFCVTTG